MNVKSSFFRSLDPSIFEQFPVMWDYALRLGETPLIEVPSGHGCGRIFAKAEWHNPNGTIKDRVAWGMLYGLLARTPPELRACLRVIEYSGGSLAVALSQLCNVMNVPLTMVVPDNTPQSVQQKLHELQAEVMLADIEDGFYGISQQTAKIAAERKLSFLYQHKNEWNVALHANTTGREIIEQLPPVKGPLAFVASTGTGGTFAGVSSVLCKHFPDTELYLCNPAELPYGAAIPPNGLPKFLGSAGFGLGRKQPFVEPIESKVRHQYVFTYPAALQGIGEFYRLTGLEIGSSAAANWQAAKSIAARLGPTGTVVTVFPSATPVFEMHALAGPDQNRS